MVAVKIFIYGLIILLGALAINSLASIFGLTNWYEFLKSPNKIRFVDAVWLFVIYPFLLGILAYLCSILFK